MGTLWVLLEFTSAPEMRVALNSEAGFELIVPDYELLGL